MKILGGKYKGKNFYRQIDMRPTSNLARKAIFDIVGQEVKGIKVLDLFAGSGALGLEAISRGAKEVYFVEKDDKCSKIIRENLELFELNTDTENKVYYEVLGCDAFAAIKIFARKKMTFDVIVCDPPYSLGLAKKALKTLNAYDIVQPNSLLVIEHHKREDLPEISGQFRLLSRRKYGMTVMSIFEVGEKSE